MIRKIPWWGWIAAGVAILFLFNMASAHFYQRSLFNLALDYIREDQSKILKVMEENMAGYEKEILRLQNELEQNKKQQALVRAENDRLRGKIHELQTQRQNIVIPSDPDRIVDELHDLGIGSAHRRRQ